MNRLRFEYSGEVVLDLEDESADLFSRALHSASICRVPISVLPAFKRSKSRECTSKFPVKCDVKFNAKFNRHPAKASRSECHGQSAPFGALAENSLHR